VLSAVEILPSYHSISLRLLVISKPISGSVKNAQKHIFKPLVTLQLANRCPNLKSVCIEADSVVEVLDLEKHLSHLTRLERVEFVASGEYPGNKMRIPTTWTNLTSLFLVARTFGSASVQNFISNFIFLPVNGGEFPKFELSSPLPHLHTLLYSTDEDAVVEELARPGEGALLPSLRTLGIRAFGPAFLRLRPNLRLLSDNGAVCWSQIVHPNLEHVFENKARWLAILKKSHPDCSDSFDINFPSLAGYDTPLANAIKSGSISAHICARFLELGADPVQRYKYDRDRITGNFPFFGRPLSPFIDAVLRCQIECARLLWPHYWSSVSDLANEDWVELEPIHPLIVAFISPFENCLNDILASERRWDWFELVPGFNGLSQPLIASCLDYSSLEAQTCFVRWFRRDEELMERVLDLVSAPLAERIQHLNLGANSMVSIPSYSDIFFPDVESFLGGLKLENGFLLFESIFSGPDFSSSLVLLAKLQQLISTSGLEEYVVMICKYSRAMNNTVFAAALRRLPQLHPPLIGELANMSPLLSDALMLRVAQALIREFPDDSAVLNCRLTALLAAGCVSLNTQAFCDELWQVVGPVTLARMSKFLRHLPIFCPSKPIITALNLACVGIGHGGRR
jgi:hypothetical protein